MIYLSISDINYDTVKKAVLDSKHFNTGKKYVWFDSPYDLNIVLIRNNKGGNTGQSLQTDRFDDLCCVCYSNGVSTFCEVFPCTTESGLKWLKRKLGKIRINGRLVARTAILLPQQARGMWNFCTSRGHKGYPAGRQVARAWYAADIDKDNYLDFNYREDERGNIKIINKKLIFYGNILSNLHRAHRWKILTRIFGYSAACVVLQRNKDLTRILSLVREQKARGLGCSTTMTLITRTKYLANTS